MNTPQITFTVMIPTYNRASLLRECLDSVFAQSIPPHEIIVVDDGSTDNSESVARSFGHQVRYVKQANAGPAAARNLGISLATGDYIVFLDSDDLWFPWTLAQYNEAITVTSGPSLVFGSKHIFERPSELGTITQKSMKTSNFPDLLAAFKAAPSTYVGTCIMAVKRTSIPSGAKFSTSRINAEDFDFALQLGTIPGCVFVHEPVTVGYREHLGSVSKSFPLTYKGLRYIVSQELAGAYPGGLARRADRCTFIGHQLNVWQARLAWARYTAHAIELWALNLRMLWRAKRFSDALFSPLKLIRQIIQGFVSSSAT